LIESSTTRLRIGALS